MTDREPEQVLAEYPDVLTGGEVAAILRLDPRRVASLAQNRELPAFRAGIGPKAGWRFDKRRIVAVIENRDPFAELTSLLAGLPPVLTAQELSDLLRIERPRIAAMAAAGAIPGAFKTAHGGGVWRFDKRRIVALVDWPPADAHGGPSPTTP
ncbi:helix-turn-helix domain-containing protein [Streptomyces sp. NPDC047525]|uniref:helix-turn-helix domain-containing protein n=1 Tax=Streptomyces sp. NPDC047525 TaxID=3155264 RepID=UPI0033EBD373